MKKVLLLVVLPVLLIAGGTYAWGSREPAVGKTHERAVALFNAMATYPGSTAFDRAQQATRYPGVTIMVARNTADGHDIVLRITATDHRSSYFDVWPSTDAEYQATRCYRWTDDRAWDTADEVDCPAEKDIDPARAPRTEGIGDDVDRKVKRALTRGGDAAEVKGELAGVEDVAVEDIDGTIAVAVTRITGYNSGSPVRDCLLGYRSGDTVEVWRPSSIQTAPGEASCDPQGALMLYLQAPPH